MNKTKIWLIVAVSLILIGSLIFAGVMSMLEWDFTKLTTEKYETNEHTVSGEYRNIIVKTKTANVDFIPSANGGTSVVCYEAKKQQHTVSLDGDTLVVEINDERKWYDHIGIGFISPKVTVYIPQGEYNSLSVKTSTGDVDIPRELVFDSIDIAGSTGDITCRASVMGLIKIKNSTGDICLENVSAGRLDLKLTTGKITLTDINCEGDLTTDVSTGKTDISNVTCESLTSDGSTGSILLENVVASGKFFIERDTGNVRLDGCDAAEIYIETDTGNVSGSLLTSKVFITDTDTGNVDVPRSAEGGRCEISTDTGDIEIEIDIK